ncbi:MAG TPA: pilus assembly protein N-terminal domain-containing protein, partial [Xanthobacteraceae bacterium]
MSGRSRSAAGALGLRGVLALSLLAAAVFAGRAQDLQYVRAVTIPVNKSATLMMPAPFTSAVVGAPEIADALPMTDRTLLIQAKKIGTTNISVFNSNNRLIKVVEVQVTLNTGNLQSQIRALTRDPGIRVSSDNGQVVLSGVARNAANADQAVNLAKSWAQNGNVINAIRVTSPQQVLLKVRFLEVARNAGRELGININATNSAGTRGASTGLGQVTATNPTIGGTGTTSVLQPLFQATGTLVGNSVGAPFGTVLAEIVNNGVKI